MAQVQNFLKGKTRSRLIWFGREVQGSIRDSMKARLAIAGATLRDAVLVNISEPVGRSGGRVTERSKPGEFPRAELGKLRQSIFLDLTTKDEAVVGTTLDYGLILETSVRLDRSYLVRTLNEEFKTLVGIFSAPLKIKGG